MKSDRIVVTNSGDGMSAAMDQAAAAAAYRGLNKKNALHIRLLAEEMLGMVRQITGQTTAEFWVESEGNSFQLHLIARTLMTDDVRQELLSVSTSGKNAAAVGVMGKLRDIFERAFTAANPNDPISSASYFTQGLVGAYPDTMDPMMLSLNASISAEMMNWSMQKYRSTVEQQKQRDSEAQEEWDELEKSIIANLADEVTISIRGGEVEMVVFKNF